MVERKNEKKIRKIGVLTRFSVSVAAVKRLKNPNTI